MAYFIFQPNKPDTQGVLFKIAANDIDLNNLNINKNDYNIIKDTEFNFESVQLDTQEIISYTTTNTIVYKPVITISYNELSLDNYIKNFSKKITEFLNNNKNHLLYSIWESYNTQLISTDIKSITYPLNMSLEQYYKSQNLIVLNPLQLP